MFALLSHRGCKGEQDIFLTFKACTVASQSVSLIQRSHRPRLLTQKGLKKVLNKCLIDELLKL